MAMAWLGRWQGLTGRTLCRSLSRSVTSSSQRDAALPRLVQTHSSFLDGLIPLLEKVREHYVSWARASPGSPSLHTIVPSRLSRTRRRVAGFRVTVSTETEEGYKVLVRRGSSVQEVFFVGGSREGIDKAFRRALPATREKTTLRHRHPPAPPKPVDMRALALIHSMRSGR